MYASLVLIVTFLMFAFADMRAGSRSSLVSWTQTCSSARLTQ
jgi:hypothetical protein